MKTYVKCGTSLTGVEVLAEREQLLVAHELCERRVVEAAQRRRVAEGEDFHAPSPPFRKNCATRLQGANIRRPFLRGRLRTAAPGRLVPDFLPHAPSQWRSREGASDDLAGRRPRGKTANTGVELPRYADRAYTAAE